MASPNMLALSMSSSGLWKAKPSCPPNVATLLEKKVNSFPSGWVEEPITGEIFDDVDHAERRLRAFALAEGFDIRRTGGGPVTNPGARFQCYQYALKTRNYRRLEEYVQRNKEGEIISRRKRENTHITGSGCNWQVNVSFKDLDRRGSGNKAFQLTVKSLDHVGHPLLANPLSIQSHRKDLEEFRAVQAAASLHRQAVIPFSTSRRIFEAMDEFGVTLTAKEYYNSLRYTQVDKRNAHTIAAIQAALEDTGFLSSCRVAVSVADGTRKLAQIWFSHSVLLEAAARFVSDFLLVIDGTFNTNNLRMPLLVAVGILNSGATFPVAFSFCPAENSDSYDFFWRCMKEYVFKGK